MTNYYEIDFLDVESKRSGDAITIRYELNDQTFVHVVDAGFQATGESVIDHIRKYYPGTAHIDHVVVTHADGDHAGGLRTVLEEFTIGSLWILRPWNYADELIHRFSRYTNVENLKARLKEVYPNLLALEEIALERRILMVEPFQGANIGAFTAVSPTREHFLDMVVESEKTPEISKIEEEDREEALGLSLLIKSSVTYLKAWWGDENLSNDNTSAENEMSVVQYANLCDDKILMTGDAGRKGMTIAVNYIEACGVTLPGLNKFQVPHHGSRRNVSSEILDRLLGPKLGVQSESGSFSAVISASKEDNDHPKKAVVRACIHRGASVISTEGCGVYWYRNIPIREGWGNATHLAYPEEQEE